MLKSEPNLNLFRESQLYGSNILISDTTFYNLKHPTEYCFRLIGRVAAKEKTEPVTLFEVFNEDSPEILDIKLKTKRTFEEAIVLFGLAEFEDSLQLLTEHLRVFPEDQAAHVYRQRSEANLDKGTKLLFKELEE